MKRTAAPSQRDLRCSLGCALVGSGLEKSFRMPSRELGRPAYTSNASRGSAVV